MYELTIIFSIIAGFLLGRFFTMLYIKNLILKIVEENGINLEEELKKLEQTNNNIPVNHHLLIEKHNDVLYLFDNLTNRFICQGSDLQEIATHIKNIKTIKQASVKFDDKLFVFKDGNFTESV